MSRLSQHKNLSILIALTLIGLLEPIISSSDALLCRHNGNISMFKAHTQAELKSCDAVIRTLVPYSYNDLDLNNRQVSPFASQAVPSFYWRHHLGTDDLGRDTLAGIVHGLRITVFLAILTVLLALIIGLCFGLLSSYQYFSRRRVPTWLILLFALFLSYLGFVWYYSLAGSGFNFTFLLLMFLGFCSFILFETKRNDYLSFDDGVSKLIETLKILPMLLILIVVSGFFDKVSYSGLITIFALLMWPSFTRLFRGEFIKLSQQDFVTSSRALGSSTYSTLFRHVVPNAMTPLITHICFAMVGVILLEATLSFLGIGVPVEEVSLGSMIKESRGNVSAWWIAVFPGLVLYLLLSNLNTLGSKYIKKG